MYGGFWIRALALLLDNVVMIAPMIVIAIPFIFFVPEDMPDKQLIGSLVKAGAFWIYFTVMESSPWQGTVGKMLLGLRVTDLDGQRISLARANARAFGKVLSGISLGIGYLMAGFTEKKQALHDHVAGTLVVRDTREPEPPR